MSKMSVTRLMGVSPGQHGCHNMLSNENGDTQRKKNGPMRDFRLPPRVT